jgi:hypothetical protein
MVSSASGSSRPTQLDAATARQGPVESISLAVQADSRVRLASDGEIDRATSAPRKSLQGY